MSLPSSASDSSMLIQYSSSPPLYRGGASRPNNIWCIWLVRISRALAASFEPTSWTLSYSLGGRALQMFQYSNPRLEEAMLISKSSGAGTKPSPKVLSRCINKRTVLCIDLKSRMTSKTSRISMSSTFDHFVEVRLNHSQYHTLQYVHLEDRKTCLSKKGPSDCRNPSSTSVVFYKKIS